MFTFKGLNVSACVGIRCGLRARAALHGRLNINISYKREREHGDVILRVTDCCDLTPQGPLRRAPSLEIRLKPFKEG